MMLEIKLLENSDEMAQVEDLQRIVWPGSETDVVPGHILLTFAHNGGLVLGAFEGGVLRGLLFGFPGIYFTADGPRPKHCSHQMGIHPDARDKGIGYSLKRAQWQIVRKQGLDRITWTYDPLLSRNGHLNIGRLGAVCSTYVNDLYGSMRDGLNAGLPSDRFQVDWWVNTRRVQGCMNSNHGPELKLTDYLAANAQILYPVTSKDAYFQPAGDMQVPEANLLLAEIPSDFISLKKDDFELALAWRLLTRHVFETCFSAGYIVTDFIFEKEGERQRSYYVLTNGVPFCNKKSVQI